MELKSLEEVSQNGIGAIYLATREFIHIVNGIDIIGGIHTFNQFKKEDWRVQSSIESIEILGNEMLNDDFEYLPRSSIYESLDKRFYFPSPHPQTGDIIRKVFTTKEEALEFSKLPMLDLRYSNDEPISTSLLNIGL